MIRSFSEDLMIRSLED